VSLPSIREPAHPNPLAAWFHFLPHWLLKTGVLFQLPRRTHCPVVMLLSTALPRRIAGVIIVLFHIHAYSQRQPFLLNWLTIVPALACFDDGFWAKLPAARTYESPQPHPPPPRNPAVRCNRRVDVAVIVGV